MTNEPYAFNGSNSSSFTRADMARAMEEVEESRRKFEAEGRKVFRFRGNLEGFKEALKRSGMEIRGDHFALQGDGPFPAGIMTFPPPGSLTVWEIDGEVWISGDRANVDEAIEGKRDIIEL